MNTSRSTCRAFTLIELVATFVLAALLMAGLLSVIQSTVRAEAQMKQQHPGEAGAQQRLIQLLRSDLMSATFVHSDMDRVMIVGLGALNIDTYQPRHLPARIEYRLEPFGGQTCLIRIESADHASVITRGRGQLLWVGVSHFMLLKTVDQDPKRPASRYRVQLIEPNDVMRVDQNIVLGGEP